MILGTRKDGEMKAGHIITLSQSPIPWTSNLPPTRPAFSRCPPTTAPSCVLPEDWILRLFATPRNWHIAAFLTLTHSGPLCMLIPHPRTPFPAPSGGKWCPTDPAQFADVFSVGHMVLPEKLGLDIYIYQLGDFTGNAGFPAFLEKP